MKRTIITGISILACLLAAGQAGAASFYGLYLAAKAGYNNSKATGGGASVNQNSSYAGAEGGYNASLAGGILVGLDLWADDHTSSVTGRDYGADLKFGDVIRSQYLFYAKMVGVAATHPGVRPHYGLGLEYKFDQNLGALVEWTEDRKTVSNTNYQNDDFVVGLTYHF